MYRVYNMVLLPDVMIKCCSDNSMGHSIYTDPHSGGLTKSRFHNTPALEANGYATNDFIRESMTADTNMKNKLMSREQNTVARPLWKKLFTPTTNPSTVQWPFPESRTKCFRHKNLQFGKIMCFCKKKKIRNFSTRIVDYITHQDYKTNHKWWPDTPQPTRASFWERQCTCKMTWRCMYVTTVAVEKQ
jgi:hypothetical protein